jgi:hypothetical protein
VPCRAAPRSAARVEFFRASRPRARAVYQLRRYYTVVPTRYLQPVYTVHQLIVSPRPGSQLAGRPVVAIAVTRWIAGSGFICQIGVRLCEDMPICRSVLCVCTYTHAATQGERATSPLANSEHLISLTEPARCWDSRSECHRPRSNSIERA